MERQSVRVVTHAVYNSSSWNIVLVKIWDIDVLVFLSRYFPSLQWNMCCIVVKKYCYVFVHLAHVCANSVNLLIVDMCQWFCLFIQITQLGYTSVTNIAVRCLIKCVLLLGRSEMKINHETMTGGSCGMNNPKINTFTRQHPFF